MYCGRSGYSLSKYLIRSLILGRSYDTCRPVRALPIGGRFYAGSAAGDTQPAVRFDADVGARLCLGCGMGAGGTLVPPGRERQHISMDRRRRDCARRSGACDLFLCLPPQQVREIIRPWNAASGESPNAP